MLTYKDLPVVSFETEQDFDNWLSANHEKEKGLWLRYFKKGSNLPSIRHDQAVDVALCWGWIDGLLNKYDEVSYVVRFTPRRPKSTWSQVNVAKVTKLIQEGRMKPSGIAQVELAKKDGRWDIAYAPASKMEVPADFIELLKKEPETYAFYQTLNKTNLYAIGYRLTTITDPQKWAKKANQILEKLRNKQKFHE